MKRLLFIRNVKRPTGGNVGVRDYFFHALAFPHLETHIFFAPGSNHLESGLWTDLPMDRVVATPDWSATDFVFVNGKDWRLVPEDDGRFHVIHLVQHLGYASDPELLGYLRRPATRICLSRAAQESIAHVAVGPTWLVPSGVDTGLFRDDGSRQPGSVFIWGGKTPELARAIGRGLAAVGIAAHIETGWLSRPAFAARLRAADVFVALPFAAEGFYRPPLEAMACGCAVVCSDALGNRDHCIPDVTCLQPPHGDVEAHVAAVRHILADGALRDRLRRGGQALARRFDLAVERAGVHAVFSVLLDGG